jgi:transposase
MEAYPLAVRRGIVARYQEGMETWEIARMYGTCESGTRRVWQVFRDTGSCAAPPSRARPGRKPRLDGDALERIRAAVERDNDITLHELRELIGVDTVLSTYCLALKRLGLTRKKSRSTPRSGIART